MKNNNLKILVFLVIIGLIAWNFGFFEKIGLTGFTTLSLSQAQFLSNTNLPNGAFWNEKLWILTVLQDGMQQQAWISEEITPEEVELKSGTRPKNTISLDVLYSEQNCEWDIVKSGESLYSYDKRTWYCILNPLDAENQLKTEAENVCGNNVFFWANQLNYVNGIPVPGGFCVCWTRNKVGEIGRYSYSERVHTKATIELSTPERIVQTVNFDTKEANSMGYIGSNIFYKWNGYIDKDTCPNADDYHPYWFENNWKLSSEQSYISYSSSNGVVNSIPDIYINKHLLSQTDLNAIVGKFENTNYAKNTVTSENIQFGTLTDKTNFEHSILKHALDRQIANLLFTFYIKAAWVGIYQPITDLKLGDVTCTTADKVTSSYVTASVINNGDALGSGSLALDCDYPIEARDNSLDVSVSAKTTKSYKLWWQVATTSSIDKNCRVTLSSPSLSQPITKTVSCHANPMITCSAGDRECDGDKIVQCNSQGSGYTITVENCADSNKVCRYDDSGNPYCKSGEEHCGNGICETKLGENETNCPKDCVGEKTCVEKCQFDVTLLNFQIVKFTEPMCYFFCIIDQIQKGIASAITELFKIILVIVVSVLAFKIANREIGKKKKGKKNAEIALVVSALIATLIAYILWMYVPI